MDEKIMRVTISVGGRWHAFDLARQLLKRESLSRLITSFPKMKTREWGIPDQKVRSLVAKELIEHAYRKLPLYIQRIYNPQFMLAELYDRAASRYIPPDTGILVAWSSFALHTLRKAKHMGAQVILEHGSSHIEYQRDILSEEYEKWGMRPDPPHPQIAEKELQEYKEADYISVPSLFVKKTFIEKGVLEQKLLHIPYGVDLAHFKQIPKEDTVFRVIYVGSLTLRKGAQYLLQAFSELRLPHAELVLYGSLSDEIQTFVRRYASDKIKTLRVPHFELYKHYSQGSVFVLPSIEEGLARVLFEAMACGLPVIATPNTGAEDIVENGKDGFIVPIRDVGALKEKILYMYEHQDIAQQMGRSAKQKVSAGFTWDDYGDRVIAAYEKILIK